MEEHKGQILLETQDWESYCGDGCCYDYGTYLYVNGKEVEGIYHTSDEISSVIAVLEALGYEVKHTELEFQSHDLRMNFEEDY